MIDQSFLKSQQQAASATLPLFQPQAAQWMWIHLRLPESNNYNPLSLIMTYDDAGSIYAN